MKTFDTIIGNGLVAVNGRLERMDIAVRDGAVAALLEAGSAAGHEHHDASGMLVLPGAIDMHVHFREPGFTHKEDFLHGSAAAACGGVTTICDMPNTRPPVVSAERLSEKIALVSEKSHVDFGLWAGGTDVAEFPAMAAAGAIGLKVYMNRAVRASDPYAGELSMSDDGRFLEVLEAAARLDWPVAVHVANSPIDELARTRSQAAGKAHAMDVCCSYRAPASVEALSRAALFARVAGARLHIAHISLNAIEAVAALVEARRQDCRLTAEVAPPALSFAELDRLGPRGVPFAHPPRDLDLYWEALESGTIDAIATDHAPHTAAEKDAGRDNPWAAPPGYPGVETSLALAIDAMIAKKLSLASLVKVCAENPARILGLQHKGALLPGHDADINIVDPNGDWVVDEGKLHSKAGWSPFHGRRLKGRIAKTFLRGRLVAERGELVSESLPVGRFLKRPDQPHPDGTEQPAGRRIGGRA
ncbi:MAG: dihydroorotase family protein [Parvibaculaceae bacterium]